MPNPYLTQTGGKRVNPFRSVQPQKKMSWLDKISRANEVSSYSNRGNRKQVRQQWDAQHNAPDPRRQQQAVRWDEEQASAQDIWDREDAENTRVREGGEQQNSWIDAMKAFSAKNPGKKFPITNQQWKTMGQATKDKVMMSLAGGGVGGGPGAAQQKEQQAAIAQASAFKNVTEKGFFDGTIQDFAALSPADRSDFIKLASTPKAYRDSQEIAKELDGEKYTRESWKEMLRTGDEMALVPKIAEWRGIPKEQMEAEISRSKEYNKEMAPIRAVQENHAKMMASLNAGNGAGDMAAIFTFMKTLDPPSTVREGEFALAAQVGGLKDQWLNTWDKFNEGDILTQDKARPQLAELSTKILLITKQSRDGIRKDYIDRNARYGLDDTSVLGSRIFDYDNLPTFKPAGSDPGIDKLLTGDKS